MENRSDSDSTQILGDWELIGDDISKPKEVEKEIQTRVSEEGLNVPGGRRRVLPPWMDPSYEWGGGKWKEDGRKKKKSEEDIPFKDIMEALLRNSAEKVEENEKNDVTVVEMFRSMGFKFPLSPKKG